MEKFSIVVSRQDLEGLGWGYDGWDCEPGEDPGFDFVRIDGNQEGKLSWIPCDEQGKTFGDAHDTGDDRKTVQDVLELLKTGMAYEL